MARAEFEFVVSSSLEESLENGNHQKKLSMISDIRIIPPPEELRCNLDTKKKYLPA
jgi:hypothetical protein